MKTRSSLKFIFFSWPRGAQFTGSPRWQTAHGGAAELSALTDLKEETKGQDTLTVAAVIYTSGRRGAVLLSILGADGVSCFRQADEWVQFRVSSRSVPLRKHLELWRRRHSGRQTIRRLCCSAAWWISYHEDRGFFGVVGESTWLEQRNNRAKPPRPPERDSLLKLCVYSHSVCAKWTHWRQALAWWTHPPLVSGAASGSSSVASFFSPFYSKVAKRPCRWKGGSLLFEQTLVLGCPLFFFLSSLTLSPR